MKEIKINKKDDIILITNEKYNNVRHIGNILEKCPDIGTEYIYLQYGDEPWYENYYVDNNNYLYSLSEEQLTFLNEICTNWEQDLGQEGNLTLEQLKEIKVTELNASFSLEIKKINPALTSEIASWDKQEFEASEWIKNNSFSTPFINSILNGRNLNETKEDFCNKIILKASEYKTNFGTLLGRYQNLLKQLEEAQNIEDLSLVNNIL